MKWSVLFLCLFAFLSGFDSKDDLDHVTFEGAIFDSNGNSIPNAAVIARHGSTNFERQATTDGAGGYRMASLLPGIYELSVKASGFQDVKIIGISGIAGKVIRRDFQLKPASLEDSMTVSAASASSSIDVTRTVIGGALGRREIDELPTESRNPFDLIFTLPGSAAPALSDRDLADGDQSDNFRRPPEETGVFSLNGGTPFSNNLTIEGLDNNDDRAARERFTPSTNAVEEVQVIANQFSAEYGRASGGRVNLRLRGGANQYHGQAFYFFRDESLNANSFTRNSDPARGRRLPFQNHDAGASLGGPVIRDRAFFFGAYEFDHVYDHAEIAALLPIDANPSFPLPKPNGAHLGNSALDRSGKTVIINGGAAVGLYDLDIVTPRIAHTFQSRGDFNVNSKHNAFAILTLGKTRDQRGFPGGRRTLDTLRSLGRDSYSIAFADNFIASSSMVNNLRFQFSRLSPSDAPAGNGPVVIIDIDDPRDVIGVSGSNSLTRRGNLTAGTSTLSGTDRIEDRLQIQNALNLAAGDHSLKFGVDLQAIRSRFIDLTDTTGVFNFASPADFLANKPSRFQQRFDTQSELRNVYTGVFGQDDWRVRRNFTLSFGLRWDNESILKDRNNIGPRFSIAWDPFDTGKTAVRAGYGIFHNRALLRTLDDFALTSNATKIDTNNEAAKNLLDELRFPRTLAAGDPRIPLLGVRESGFLRRLSEGFRIPESYQGSAGFEREIGRGLKIEINYVFNRGLHLWREVNANAPRLPAGFDNLADYLIGRDFDNRRDPATGLRPITSTGNADAVRFDLSEQSSRTVRENGKSIVIFGLNNPSTSNATSGIRAALAAIREFRPSPDLGQIEELQSRGNSIYHALNFESHGKLGSRGFMRVSYTLSKLIDDGVVNTSSPLVAGDFKRERSLSLLDARHRIAASGSFEFPRWLSGVQLAGTFNFTSSRPFNIGANGNDRNLDDVDNDRPNFTGDPDSIRWRRSDEALNDSLVRAFSLPVIGSTGNLPRNAGRGPNAYTLNLRLSRAFNFNERRKAEVMVEAFNPLNSAVFSFGAEFVDYSPAGLSDFLVPRRVVKPRTLRVGLRFLY